MSLQVVYYGREAEALFGAYARVFVAQFGSGQRMLGLLAGFTGRVLRGRAEADFVTLTDDPRRRVVFLTDGAALCALAGSDGREILKQIGYSDVFVGRLLERQTRFKLALLPDMAKWIATWDNLLDLASAAYPDWRARIDRVRPQLKQIGSLDGEAADVRAFLEDVLNVNHLFAGDGYTRREGDPLHRVHPEYVVLNRPLAEMGAYCLIDFPVEAG